MLPVVRRISGGSAVLEKSQSTTRFAFNSAYWEMSGSLWKNIIRFLALVLPAVFSQSSLSSEWCQAAAHGEHCLTPDKWSAIYEACGKPNQSPVALWFNDLEVVGYKNKEDGFQLHGYDIPIDKCQLENDGHTLMVTIPAYKKPNMTGGHLPGRYILTQFHFHWGETDLVGSEHTIGRTHYPMELHMVHVNEKTLKPEAVFAVFYQIGANTSEALQRIVDRLLYVVLPNGFKSIDPIRPSDLLPPDIGTFIRYTGSLTTPPCSTNIQWTIFTEVQNITEKELEQFRELVTFNGKNQLVNNYRPVQKLNGRKLVLYAYQSSGSRSSVPIVVVLVSIFLSY